MRIVIGLVRQQVGIVAESTTTTTTQSGQILGRRYGWIEIDAGIVSKYAQLQ